jgi:hypothetical protein
LYIDGTANIDSLVADTADINAGTIDGVTIGGASPGVATFTTANATTVDATNIEVTNIKAKDGSASATIADSTGVMTIASSVLTTADINGGTIDNATIATSNITVGAGKTLDVSAGTLTLANDQISGDKVEGGTINATTITTLTSTTGNITNVNATTVDATNIEVTNIKAKDGTAAGSIADSTGVVTLASSVLTTTDINGGTIDGTAIGGASAAAGAFTTLSASGVTTVQAGTVSAPAITTTGDTNTGIFFPAADTIAFAEGGAEVARFDSSGNLGIGVTSPVSILDVNAKGTGTTPNAVKTYTSYMHGSTIGANAGELTGWGVRYGTIASTPVWYGARFLKNGVNAASDFTIWTSPDGDVTTLAERVTVTASGNLLVGTTSQLGGVTARGVFSSTSNLLALQAGNGNVGAYMTNTSGTGNWQPFSFNNNGTSFSQIGSITCTASATAYNTSSDYRLKHDIQPMTGALAKVAQLKPVTYKWNADDSDGEGFIAHELQEVAPYAVSGEKDGEEMQGVDYGKITPLLTAALQEAIAEIQSLKARVAELEAK